MVEQHSPPDARQLHRNFDLIYDLGLWKGTEDISASGHGSESAANEVFVRFLKDLIAKRAVTSVVDVGSGAWSYMKDVGVARYVGYAVSARIVEETAARYGDANVSFRLSERGQVYEAADLLVCKDVLQHLPFAAARHILDQRGRFKIAVFVNDVADIPNVDIRAGSYRSLDVRKPPFNIKCDRVLHLHPRTLGAGGRKTTCLVFNANHAAVEL